MQAKSNYKFNSKDDLTQLIIKKGVYNWQEFIFYIQSLPYGRTTNRSDLSLNIIEHKGTCSSKHAILKKVADLNKIPNIKLILCLYKMSSNNTPKIGNVLNEYKLNYIPEAHCYLNINGLRKDYTSLKSHISYIEQDIIEEQEITPDQIIDFKPVYHQDFLKKWIITEAIPYNFKAIWDIRENCINNLTI